MLNCRLVADFRAFQANFDLRPIDMCETGH